MIWVGIGIGFCSFPLLFLICELGYDFWRTR